MVGVGRGWLRWLREVGDSDEGELVRKSESERFFRDAYSRDQRRRDRTLV